MMGVGGIVYNSSLQQDTHTDERCFVLCCLYVSPHHLPPPTNNKEYENKINDNDEAPMTSMSYVTIIVQSDVSVYPRLTHSATRDGTTRAKIRHLEGECECDAWTKFRCQKENEKEIPVESYLLLDNGKKGEGIVIVSPPAE
jgi:hypothetical protein